MNLFPITIITKQASEVDKEMHKNAKITDVRADQRPGIFTVRTQINSNDPVIFNNIPREKVIEFLKAQKKITPCLDIILDDDLYSYLQAEFHLLEYYKSMKGFNVLLAMQDHGKLTRKWLENVSFEELCKAMRVSGEQELLANPHYMSLTRFMNEFEGIQVTAFEKIQGRYCVCISGKDFDRVIGGVPPSELAVVLGVDQSNLRDKMNSHVFEDHKAKSNSSLGF